MLKILQLFYYSALFKLLQNKTTVFTALQLIGIQILWIDQTKLITTMLKKSLAVLIPLTVLLGFAFFFLKDDSITSLTEDNNRRIFNLKSHWSQGNVVALVRHAERCDRSDNQCLDGNDGITLSGSKEAEVVGDKFEYLPDQKTTIYNSPVKRTDQTAAFMFDEEVTTDQAWLRKDCKKNLYDDIFKHKKEGTNLILITHSTCIDKLGERQNNKLISMSIHDESTYNASIFMVINQPAKEAYVLGYLFADEWDQAFNQTGTGNK